MKRRNFLKFSAAALTGQLLNNVYSRGNVAAEDLDKYGGWKGRTFKATGFFRTEKAERWWLVTPEGNAFLSFGINHFNTSLWNQEYNKEAWCKKLKVEKAGSPQFYQALLKWFYETCDDFGFNTLGVHNSLPFIKKSNPGMAYMQPIVFIDIPHWKTKVSDEEFVDVFSQKFINHADQVAKKVCLPVKDDPFLLGYAMTDCALLTHEDCRERTDVIGGARRESRVGFVNRLRNFPESSPGKQTYVKLMKELYKDDINAFNKIYHSEFTSFEALTKAENWRQDIHLHNGFEVRDNIEFLKVIVEQYYKVAKSSILKYDRNHMFVGDKLNGNTDSVDSVLTVTGKYTDILFYQMYARYEVQKPGLDRWSGLVDLPVINGDSAYTMVSEHMPRPYGPVADNLKQRAEWTEEFFQNAFARKEFVGWHYCGLIDANNQNPAKKARQHSGLMDSFGQPYPELQKVMKAGSGKIYSLAQGKSE